MCTRVYLEPKGKGILGVKEPNILETYQGLDIILLCLLEKQQDVIISENYEHFPTHQNIYISQVVHIYTLLPS